MTAVTLLPVPTLGLVGRLWLQHVWCCYSVVGSVPYQTPVLGVVGWEPHSGRKQNLYVSVWCKLLAY